MINEKLKQRACEIIVLVEGLTEDEGYINEPVGLIFSTRGDKWLCGYWIGLFKTLQTGTHYVRFPQVAIVSDTPEEAVEALIRAVKTNARIHLKSLQTEVARKSTLLEEAELL